jgi:uncharacterized protein YgiM (DUF1202 family)
MRINLLNNIAAIILVLLLEFKICSAQAASLFQGEVNADNINVRSDATVGSEIIYTLNKNERVDVVLELYEWYKIKLPKNAPSYIKKSLVDCIAVLSTTEKQCKNARVLKNRVNIRLHPNESSTIIGTVDENEIVNILKDEGGWYRIDPVQNSFGWINKKFVNKTAIPRKR